MWTAFAIGLGALVLAVILFILLRPDDDEPATDTASTPVQTTVETTTEATTEVTTTVETTTETAPTTTEPPPDQPVRVRIRVDANAQPVGGVQDHQVAEGDEVLLIVTSDVEDEVHLHGYDLAAAVAPGNPARIRFTADSVGEFEIELEERVVPIGNLVVS
jgi:hypothetical protein